MNPPLFALTASPPRGFSQRTELSRSELRRAVFAVYTENPADVLHELDALRDKITGLLVTPSSKLRWRRCGDRLYQLEFPAELQNVLPELLQPHLELLGALMHLAEGFREKELDLARAVEDRSRLVREFGDLRSSLLQEIGDRRAAEGELQKAHDQLEVRVEQRTAELGEANRALEAEIIERRRTEEELRTINTRLEEVLTDLTRSHEDLKRAQLQLIQAEKMQSVGSLAAGVAHEVKNPLAILEMGLGCLITQPDLDAESRQLVHQEMKDAVRRANTVISGLLNYSSSKELDIHACDLHSVLEQALHLMRHEFINRKITVAREFAADFPRCQIDAQKIEQVFINLFTNACHAMPTGGMITVTTEVKMLVASDVHWDAGDRSGSRLREDERVAVVKVRDTGTGIPPEKLGKVFDPFFTTKPTGLGTGLGLTVARKIIDLHGGRLELANAPGEGAIATVLFNLR